MNKTNLARHWALIVARGAAAVAFGLAACFFPTLTGAALVWVFGAYALVDGAVAIASGLLRQGRRGRRWAFLAEGVLG
ncbi:MAG TPA: DUF308 domain-containing protein, partial [Anaerolineales bacterium]|nr:DUF308 domain-containing protein [Anaerolineales bacterium]